MLDSSTRELEGLVNVATDNSTIRLINHRAYSHHSASALIAIDLLCAGDITIDLPPTLSVPT
jgi:hypothetical protein